MPQEVANPTPFEQRAAYDPKYDRSIRWQSLMPPDERDPNAILLGNSTYIVAADIARTLAKTFGIYLSGVYDAAIAHLLASRQNHSSW
ncbi:hypothetical protein [Chroococcidiopsis thermalis]|uniref:Uncharacterized protein n=1 Tax=Chroococcidiopsis thermalis (strain PCC 7203) TaxID=251229 RepID=K9U9Q4_CHRTP|nr:hypothetical protein [Chroococcidiopsis thermalis]AFY91166.1 hypothetical protein Chro_5827 [Chroococcidiopsis thermalis PCC 7203]